MSGQIKNTKGKKGVLLHVLHHKMHETHHLHILLLTKKESMLRVVASDIMRHGRSNLMSTYERNTSKLQSIHYTKEIRTSPLSRTLYTVGLATLFASAMAAAVTIYSFLCASCTLLSPRQRTIASQLSAVHLKVTHIIRSNSCSSSNICWIFSNLLSTALRLSSRTMIHPPCLYQGNIHMSARMARFASDAKRHPIPMPMNQTPR